ncbi:hypothetical protein K439DRAFT_1356982 [Ramaria rubella]|nr:hypothetical protein K439DRAFT_1356982 [Ramaria rubella]
MHALLHIPRDIQTMGPVWINWSFVMERYCGQLLAAIKSKCKPYTVLSCHSMHLCQISESVLKYGLCDTLNFDDHVSDISHKEFVYPECMSSHAHD